MRVKAYGRLNRCGDLLLRAFLFMMWAEEPHKNRVALTHIEDGDPEFASVAIGGSGN